MRVSRPAPLPAARLALAIGLFVAGCVPTPPSRPVAPPAPTPAPPPVVAPTLGPDWQDWPVTAGTWRYGRDARGTRATYGVAGVSPLVTLTCDRAARTVTIARTGTIVAPFTIRTTSLTRIVAAQPAGGQPLQVAARLAATDPLLDAIAFSRGRFTLEQPGATPLVLPPWAEIGRVIEDCRG
jgi:hypothetical protein